MPGSTYLAVTNARFVTLHRLAVGPVPLSTPPVPLLKPCARHERHSRCAARAAGFRLRLGGGVSLRLRFARRSSPPALHFPARRPQTEAGFKEAFGQTSVLSKGAQRTQYPASESSRNPQPFGSSPGQRDEPRSIVRRRRARQGYYGSVRLDAPASVPPLTRPPPPGFLPLGFHRGNLSLFNSRRPLRESYVDEPIRFACACSVNRTPAFC